jgi:hypothetical protein
MRRSSCQVSLDASSLFLSKNIESHHHKITADPGDHFEVTVEAAVTNPHLSLSETSSM